MKMTIELDTEEVGALMFALAAARKNCIEPDGVGSYGGEICERLENRIEELWLKTPEDYTKHYVGYPEEECYAE